VLLETDLILSTQELNSLPARVTLNGKRYYNTPFNSGPAASVTTILSETASEANKQKLAMWSKNNPGKKEEAAERGTTVHSYMEHYLKKEDFEVDESLAHFWTKMPALLDQFDEVIWAETPLLDAHIHALSNDGVGRVFGRDSENRAWAGSPDIIGVVKNKLTLADLKTAEKPYCRTWPTNKNAEEYRTLLSGHLKFKKTVLQLAAYDLGIEQTLGLKIQQAAIIVALPNRTQVFKISRNYLNVSRDKWLKLVEEYYKQVETCGVYDADLI
jgi:hypothetical protein